MVQYKVQDPDGQMHIIDGPEGAAPDEIISQAQALIPPPPDILDLDKAKSNIIPDIKQTAQGLGETASTYAPLLGGDPVPALQSLVKQGVNIAQNPVEAAKAIARPVMHPFKYAEEHPVQQAMNVLALFQGLGGLAKGEAVPTVAAEEGAVPTLAETAGSRIKARTISQALDLNPTVVNRLASKAKMTPEAMTIQLGEDAAKHLPADFVTPSASANTKLATVLKTRDTVGQELGKIFKAVGEGTEGQFPEGQEAIAELKAAAEDYRKVDGGETAILKTANNLEKLQKAGKLDFDQLHKYQSDIGSGFQEKNTPPGTHEIFDVLNDKTQGAVDRLSVEDPALAPELARLKGAYTVTSRLAPAMARKAAREIGGASVGGGLGSKAIPALIGNMLGGPAGAVAGAGAKWLQEAMVPDLGKNLAYMAMKSKPNLNLAVPPQIPLATMVNQASNADVMDSLEKLKKKFSAPLSNRK